MIQQIQAIVKWMGQKSEILWKEDKREGEQLVILSPCWGEYFKFGFIGELGLSGVQGRSPCTSPRWPGVSGAAVSAPTRGGSRKKIGYNE